jgi:hypothetical protein
LLQNRDVQKKRFEKLPVMLFVAVRGVKKLLKHWRTAWRFGYGRER